MGGGKTGPRTGGGELIRPSTVMSHCSRNLTWATTSTAVWSRACVGIIDHTMWSEDTWVVQNPEILPLPMLGRNFSFLKAAGQEDRYRA